MSRRVTLRRGLAAFAMTMLVSGVAPYASAQVAPESPVCLKRTKPPQIGLKLLNEKQSGRLVELRLRSTAMGSEQRFGGPGEQPVNVLLPANYDPSGATRYPVLYLLHGFTGNYAWDLPVESIVGERQVIVVMPDGGYNGAYTDWYGRVPGIGGAGEPPAWETYHLRELVPFIDDHFPTIGRREGRAIAGISMGGHGAMKYATRRPDLFMAAGSLSGAVNTTQDWPHYSTVSFVGLSSLTLAPGAGPASHCAGGDPYTQQVYWEDNNPFYLASNLHGVALWISSGDGGDGTEDYIRRMNEWFIGMLEHERIPYTNTFRPGTHTAPFWIEDLRKLVPWVMDRFEQPTAAPRLFDYRGMSNHLEAWGWSFEATKDVKEFTYIDGISRKGFTISGSGGVSVETAALYSPGRRYVIDGAARRPVVEQAGRDHRLRFTIDLGPAHTVQQYRFECACWNDLDGRSGLVDVFGDNPEMRDDWQTRVVRIKVAR